MKLTFLLVKYLYSYFSRRLHFVEMFMRINLSLVISFSSCATSRSSLHHLFSEISPHQCTDLHKFVQMCMVCSKLMSSDFPQRCIFIQTFMFPTEQISGDPLSTFNITKVIAWYYMRPQHVLHGLGLNFLFSGGNPHRHGENMQTRYRKVLP